MGGAAGHMAHPFDCREVRNGRDLINFYIKAVNAIPLYEETDFDTDSHSTSLKLDGVNASFRLQPANNSAGFTFVVDRGSKSMTTWQGKLDRAGITPDNAEQRFNPDGKNPDHGMLQVVRHLHQILNHDLEKLKPYVEALGIFDQMGPDGVFFDVEYYTKGDDPEGPNAERGYQRIGNVVPYTQNFIAIHGMKDFFIQEKTSAKGKVTTSRLNRGFYWKTNEEINDLLTKKDELLAQGQDVSEIDRLIAEKNKELGAKKREHQKILDDFGKALAQHANELDLGFDVHTKIGLQFQEGLSRELILKRIDEALNQELKGFPYKKINENMSIGPTVINEQTGEVRGRTLKELLLAVKQNPAHVAFYPDQIKKTNNKGESKPVTGMIFANPEWVQKHKKPKNGRQSPFAKKFYEDVFGDGEKAKPTGVGAFNLGADDKSGQAINDAVIMWQAVRVIGQILKEAVVADTDLGVPMGEQEGIVIQSEKICDGIAFKFTGDFITGGKASPFRKDAQEPLMESKFKYGEILESYAIEAAPVTEQKQKTVILLPGGFKPPTGGHYAMIKHYEEQSDVAKVIIITGKKQREGVTYQQSQAIFQIYGGFSDKVEFLESNDATPLLTCYELMKNDNFVSQYPNMSFSLGAGNKGKDPKRINDFVKYFEKKPELSKANLVSYAAAPSCEVDACPASASRMRKAYRDGDWELFKKLLPDDNFYDDVVQVMNGQQTDVSINPGGSMVAENFLLAYPPSFLVNEVYSEKQRRFMCAVKDQPASKRPKGLSAAEAEEMCKSKGLKRVAEQEGESAIQLKMDNPSLQAFETEIEQFVKNIENDTDLDMSNPDVQNAIINSITSIIKDKFGGGISEISTVASVQGALSKVFTRKQNNDNETRINRRSKA